MTALSADAERLTRNDAGKVEYELVVGTASTIYRGSLVNLDTGTGRCVVAAAETSRAFIGMAIESATGNTAGSVRCRVVSNLEAQMAIATTALTTADLYQMLHVADDNTVSDTIVGTALVRVLCGYGTESISTGLWWVFLGKGAPGQGTAT